MSVLKWTMPRLSAMARMAQVRVLALGRVGEKKAETMVGTKSGKEKNAIKGHR